MKYVLAFALGYFVSWLMSLDTAKISSMWDKEFKE